MKYYTLAGCAAAVSLVASAAAAVQQKQPPPATVAPAPNVQMKDLENEPSKYLNQRVTVQAEVEGVLGPRVFKIDEANWVDLDRELLVVMEAPLAALVKEDDRVTVSGTMRSFVDVHVDREWGWLDLDPEIEARIKTRPVLVATRIVGGDPSAPMFFTVQEVPSGTAGTSGAGEPRDNRPTLTNLGELAKASDHRLVGRAVNLSSVRVDRTVKEGGFWITSGGDELFVLPADQKAKVQAGQTVSVQGHVMRLPEQMESRLERRQTVGNEEVYVFATTLR